MYENLVVIMWRWCWKFSSYTFEIKSYESLFFCLVSVYILLDTKTKCALAYTTYMEFMRTYFYVAFMRC